MIRKKRCLAAKMGLLALAIAMLLPGQKVDAADKKTIYNSPYVSFSHLQPVQETGTIPGMMRIPGYPLGLRHPSEP